MTIDHSAEDRLSELVWRTVKLRVSLLAIPTILLLIVWSSLTSGDQRAHEIDVQYCRLILSDSKQETPALAFDPEVWCTDHGARNFVEGTRATNGILLMGVEAVEDQARKDKILRIYNARKARLAEYDAKRRAAYPLQIQLSSEYSGSSVILNGQFVAQLLPFVVLIFLAVVVLLGFQQAAYKRQLESLLVEADTKHRGLATARSQFFAGLEGRRGVRSLAVLAPEKMAVGSLYVLFLASFATVFVKYIAAIVNLTDSILLSYPCAVFAAAFLLIGFLIHTRTVYLENGLLPEKIKDSGNLRRVKIWSLILVTVACLSLIFPWAISGANPALRGFEFILSQKSVNQIGDFTIYRLDPRTFIEIRIQLLCTFGFLLIVFFNSIFPFRRKARLARIMHRVEKVFAILILFLSVNYLIYMVILECGAALEDNPFASHFLAHEQGLPMSLYDPAPGFIVFISCCFVLIWFSLSRRTSMEMISEHSEPVIDGFAPAVQ